MIPALKAWTTVCFILDELSCEGLEGILIDWQQTFIGKLRDQGIDSRWLSALTALHHLHLSICVY